MAKDNKKPYSNKVELKGRLSEFRKALEEEIEAIESNGQNSIVLTNGKRIEAYNDVYKYYFSVEYMPVFQTDTPCKLTIGKEQYDVAVISCEENAIIIAAKANLPENIGKASLDVGSTILMERLIKCIEENAEKDNPAGDHILPQYIEETYCGKKLFSYDNIQFKDENEGQKRAVKTALEYDCTFIWGPPGTGKSTVIGKIINELYEHNRSVLLLSHTNTAVDGAIKKADKKYQENKINPILHLGDIKNHEIDRTSLIAHVKELGKELEDEKNTLIKRQEELQRQIDEYEIIIAKEMWLKHSRRHEIQSSAELIDELQKKKRIQEEKVKQAKMELLDRQRDYPEYGLYTKVTEEHKKKLLEYHDICEEIAKIKTAITEIDKQYHLALDEIKKHEFYEEFHKEEASYMSGEFYEKELKKISADIVTIESEIDALKRIKRNAELEIAEYEKKNQFAKILYGKKKIEQIRLENERTNVEIKRKEDELSRKTELSKDYQQQYNKKLYLLEKLKSFTPTKTKDYWLSFISELQEKQQETKKKYASCVTQSSELLEAVRKLDALRITYKKSFDVVNQYDENLQKIQTEIASLEDRIKQEEEHYQKTLNEEFDLCQSFKWYIQVEKQDYKEICQQLSALALQIQHDLQGVDIFYVSRKKEESEEELQPIASRLTEIANKLAELERQVIITAPIIGTTLTKSYLSETLRERKFDTVIVDEASMASIPALWCASYLAAKSIVIVGDFLQLSPIVIASKPMAQKWLGQDIFYLSGMQERAKKNSPKGKPPENFVMLNEQFRMEKEIADIVNGLYYGEYGGLKSHSKKDKTINEFYSWYGEKNKANRNVHLIDTESLHAWATGIPQGKSHSRMNCLSAEVCVHLAFEFINRFLKSGQANEKNKDENIDNFKVLIVAPYKPHVARINKLIQYEYDNRAIKETPSLVKAGTVHSFQGEEADIVIFDLVVDEPHRNAGLFLPRETKDEKHDYKEYNRELEKMFNVAATRAKFQWFIVGNFSFCQKHAKNNALSDLLHFLLTQKRYKKEDAKPILPKLSFAKQNEMIASKLKDCKSLLCTEGKFAEYFIEDLQLCKERIIIYSPFMTELRIGSFFSSLYDLIHKGKQVIVITKELAERGKKEYAQYAKCEEGLKNIGVFIYHKKGMHEKIILIDDDIIWTGSLNSLSFTGNTGEIMERRVCEEIAKDYKKILNVDSVLETINKSYEKHCPICDGEMLIKEGKHGGIYWECVNKDYSRSIDQPYPLDGILRCYCGAPYCFSIKNEPRWVCSKNPKHRWQKMRESDLKFVKMAALLTQTEMEKVNEFFSKDKKNTQMSLFDE